MNLAEKLSDLTLAQEIEAVNQIVYFLQSEMFEKELTKNVHSHSYLLGELFYRKFADGFEKPVSNYEIIERTLFDLGFKINHHFDHGIKTIRISW